MFCELGNDISSLEDNIFPFNMKELRELSIIEGGIFQVELASWL